LRQRENALPRQASDDDLEGRRNADYRGSLLMVPLGDRTSLPIGPGTGFLRAGIMLLIGLALAPGAMASCTVYEHRHFLGESLRVADNGAVEHLGSLNDRVSSMIVSPDCLLIAYADPRFAGATMTFSAGRHPSLPDGWDDQISSVRCNCR